MSAGVVTQFARDSKSGLDFPTKWLDDGLGTGEQQVFISALQLPSGVTPVQGQFSNSGVSAPFSLLPGRGFNATTWGTYFGGVQLNRSFDGGTTWIPVDTSTFIAPASRVFQEPEAGVLYQFQCTSMTSGTANYRLSQ